MAKIGLLELGQRGLVDWLSQVGEKPYRARQIWEAVIKQRHESFLSMTTLPAALRQKLADELTIFTSTILSQQVDDDSTKKLVLGFPDQQTIECVLLLEQDRRTVCLSTQVGCGMGCVFCASGLNGVARNLTAGEMIEELLRLRNLLPASERLSHIVVMGMGEPLANLKNLLPVLDFASSPEGLGISQRHITISTVGLVNGIRQLAEAGKSYHLAVSLHAPTDELRRKIVPTAEKLPIEKIIEASDEFRHATGRQVTFEYVLLAGINDQEEHARALVRLLGRRDAMINLIPYNPVEGLPYHRPTDEDINRFTFILHEAGYTIKVRKRKGNSIDAACGQLRRRVMQEMTPPLLSIGDTNRGADVP